MAAASPKLIVSAAAQDGTASNAANSKILPRTMGTSQPMILLAVKGYESRTKQCPRHCCRGDRVCHTRSTKLSTTFFSPAFSKAMVSLLPSIFTTLP